MLRRVLTLALLVVAGGVVGTRGLDAQGVTTAAMSGIVTDQAGSPLAQAVIVAVHVPSNTRYQTLVRSGGAYNIPNMRVGGPYTVTVRLIGYAQQEQQNIFVSLGQDLRLNFQMAPQAVVLAGLVVTAEEDEILNADRTGAATFISPEQVALLPSIKRSTRDLIRTDPRNDGNYAFGGRNWLYNNISLDGSYFNNSFGLDDPAPGGQTNAEPVPFDAVEEVQVSIAPFDVRQGGFTGANVNTVTKSGTNQFRGSAYTFYRNESLLGNKVSGSTVIANPDLTFLQSGASLGGPIIPDKLFFFINGEIERTDDPGTNFVASTGGASGLGISRVDAAVMGQIRDRMIQEYGYDPGPYEGFVHETNNNKLLAKLDWNINDKNTFWLRYNYLDAERDLPPHPFVLSYANSGRGPNSSSLPFQNSGYAINNEVHSIAMELNTLSSRFANRFFASYNRFRDFRSPFAASGGGNDGLFPTIEIGEGGVTYTTVGQEPFSIHNILDTDVLQLTNNFSYFAGRHVLTVGANFERFSFFNSFNIFRHGVFFLPYNPTGFGGTTFATLADFFNETDPANPNQADFSSFVTPATAPYKGEKISIGQLGFYVQDEVALTDRFSLTAGVRVDFPLYFTDPVANPFSTGLTALDENGNSETVDQASLPGATPLFSPRVGFNLDVTGDRSTQIRGGTGIFTGRVPFVWVGNVISNPGANPNLWAPFSNEGVEQIPTSDDAILQQSFDLNAMDPDFKWPQVWTSDIAIDQRLPGDVLGTVEFIYGKDIHSIYMRNADLVAPVRTLADGRPYYGGFGANELNPDGGAGIYVIDNTSEGYNFSVTAQLRKAFTFGLNAQLAYSFTEAKNNLKSTEIASVLWQNQPVQGDPNNPQLAHSEFGQRHRIVGGATYSKAWSDAARTQIGVFLEIGQGNRFAGAGGNRYSYIYSGDVNGDGQGGNDLIYIPASESEINLNNPADWAALDAFIEQDKYLSSHRGQIAERFGALNPMYQTVDLRVLQDFAINAGGNRHGFQLSVDILNVGNLINSDWGVRKVASPAATSPLTLTGFDAGGEPEFDFTGPSETFVDDPSVLSRWQIQIGLRYLLN
ncbi:MAG: carboxypeptidase regulatory-like domain-containing protein [Gemmatimonadota bacterium]|nr:carboxypeptidase regulatory-like domain-containing protein [Gemmatimonadota bacterium]